MPSFADLAFFKKITSLLRAGADWIKQRGQFGKPPDAASEHNIPFMTSNQGEEFSWVFDPKNKYWVMELTYSFRSFECRFQTGEAKTPPGLSSLRRIIRNTQ